MSSFGPRFDNSFARELEGLFQPWAGNVLEDPRTLAVNEPLAVELGIAKKSGAWFTYDGEQLGQGRENSKQFLADNPDVMMQMTERVRQKAMGVEAVEAGFSPADEKPIDLE